MRKYDKWRRLYKVKTFGTTHHSKRINIINKLKGIHDILEIHELLEPYDLMIKVRTFDIHSLKENVLHVLNNLDGVMDSSSILTTKCHKEKACNILRK